MTGFGRGVAEQGGTRATVDVRTVNHRFLDLKLRGAVAPALEDAIGTRVRGAIERGSVTVSVHLARATGGAAMRIDADAARAAHQQLAELARTLGVPGPDLALVLAQPGVVVAGEEEPREDADTPAVLAALDAALVQLAGMRDGEGQALAKELLARLDELSALRATLERLAADVPERLQRRLQQRLERLLQDEVADKGSDAAGWLDPGRLAQEVALLADRADVTEELVRLASHLDQARALVSGTTASGRRLDFLIQEIGRELNTIGSKAAATEISSVIVEAKAVLEKVREQVQNVE
ncbi:MAG TPA: YicC/YloC family endoribonuclease [Kofleriaceae bacterium]|nr:YicC/YloC family endoribonuclease [Kofleriaceae bacterium]